MVRDMNERTTTEVKIDNGRIEDIIHRNPEEAYQDLITRVKKYHPSDDVSLIESAYSLAKEAHKDQKRKSGEPYIIHPLETAIILAELQLDKESIVSGLLHDVVEDTDYTYEDIKEKFGEYVAIIVEGVTKLEKIKYNGDKLEYQAENLRKMFLAMSKDIRVIMVKLADRLHNMRTLQFQPPEKQKEIARETLDIYAPLAERLGISKVKVELDDLSFKYLNPEAYKDLVDKVAVKKGEREDYVQSIIDEVSKRVLDAGIDATFDGRVKHFFSIYRKMVNQNKTLDQIYDLFAVRILVNTVPDCYAALGVIHDMYKPIPGRFKDYIAMPKPNMYRSLHTTLIGPNGKPFEIQIRTYDMHRTAEYGIAAHWKYKEASNGKKPEESEAEKMTWLRRILDWQVNLSDNKEFLNLVKSDFDLFSDTVYCFTPEGDVKTLPAGSTPVDFAYAIHSGVGNRMSGARVNGQLVTINYEIKNGDRVEIITSQNVRGPSRDWLKIVKSTQARNKINQWFKNELKDENISKGKELMLSFCHSKSIDPAVLFVQPYMQAIMDKYGFKEWNMVYAAVGHGGLREGTIINRMQELYDKDHPHIISNDEILEDINDPNRQNKIKVRSRGGVEVMGADGVAVKFSKCCSPIPGDEIVGYVTRGRGVSIHRSDCINMLNLPEEERMRVIEAEWEEEDKSAKTDEKYLAEIRIYASDRQGLLADITKTLTEKGVNIISMNVRQAKNGVCTDSVTFSTSGTMELMNIIEKLRQVESVIDIERTRG